MSRHTPLHRLFAVLVAVFTLGPAARGQAPTGKYPFANPPLDILDQLGKAGVGKPEPLAEGDRAFLAEFWAARTRKSAKEIPPADDAAVTAHLIASGVSDPKDRAAYVRRFTELVDRAQGAVLGATSDAQKADRLLRFLHKEVMAKGYEEKQTSLATVFDAGKYNCVSSACLYYLVG